MNNKRHEVEGGIGDSVQDDDVGIFGREPSEGDDRGRDALEHAAGDDAVECRCDDGGKRIEKTGDPGKPAALRSARIASHSLCQDIAFIVFFRIVIYIDAAALGDACHFAELVIDVLDLRADHDLYLSCRIEHLKHAFRLLQAIEVDLALILHDKAQARDAVECLADIVRSPDMAEDVPAQLLILHELPFLCGNVLP